MDGIQVVPAVTSEQLLCDSLHREESSLCPSPLPMSTESVTEDNGDGLPNPCRHVLRELIDTERAYVEALQEVIEGYIDPMTTQDFLPIKHRDREALFGNTTDLCEFSGQLAREFEEAGQNLEELAACFHRNERGFKMYTDYCNNYPRAVEVLAEAQRDPTMSEFFKGCQLALGHMLPLGAFLLKPVQRILKYHLLLADLLKQYGKHVGKDDEAYQELNAAKTTMAGVAEYINAMKRKHEASVRTQEITSQVVGWDTKVPVGMLVLDDSFRVQGARDRRIIYLFERIMLITKRSKEGISVYKGHLHYAHMALSEHLKDPLSWEVASYNNKDFHMVIVAKNAQQKQQWVAQLRHLILENNPNLTEEVRQRMQLSWSKENISSMKKNREGTGNLAPQPDTGKQDRPQSDSGVSYDNEVNSVPVNDNKTETPVPFTRGRRLKKVPPSSTRNSAREASKHKQSMLSNENEGTMQDEVSVESVAAVFEDGSLEVSGNVTVGVEGSIGAVLLDEVAMDLSTTPEPEPSDDGVSICSSSSSSKLEATLESPAREKPPPSPTSDMCESDDEVSELMVDQPDAGSQNETLSDAPDIMVPESHIKEFNIQPKKMFAPSPQTLQRNARAATIVARRHSGLKRSSTMDMMQMFGGSTRHSVGTGSAIAVADANARAKPELPAVDKAEMLERTRGLVQRLVKRYTELVTEDEAASSEGQEKSPSSSGTKEHRQSTLVKQASVSTESRTLSVAVVVPQTREADFLSLEKKITAWKVHCRQQPAEQAAVNVKRSHSLALRSSAACLWRCNSIACVRRHHGISFRQASGSGGDERPTRRAMLHTFTELRRESRRLQMKPISSHKRIDCPPPIGRVRRLIEKFSVQPM